MKNIIYLKGFFKATIGDWLELFGLIVLFIWTLSVAASFSYFWIAGFAWMCIVSGIIYQRWNDYLKYLKTETKIRLDSFRAMQEREKLEKKIDRSTGKFA